MSIRTVRGLVTMENDVITSAFVEASYLFFQVVKALHFAANIK